jgi:hypothetical protein
MKNILFLGTKIKLLPIYNYVKDKHHCRFYSLDEYHSNNDLELDKMAYTDDSIFNNWKPDLVINLKEQNWYLQKEKEICERFNIHTFLNYDNIQFFSSKAEQDRIFKELRIPTVPNDGDEVICKSDLSGGTNFKIVPREEATGFFQNNIEIEYIVSCHFYADDEKWYWLNNHVMFYVDNCPSQSYTPYEIRAEDFSIIEESVWKLSQKISVKNRLFGWQFLKDVDGNLYSIDFNLRPFGGYDKGSYDWDISNQNWTSYLFGNKPPKQIVYTNSVECIYTEKQKFGYAPWERLKSALPRPYIMEVVTYDNI